MMKKIFVFLVVGFAIATNMHAQQALGLRLGGGSTNGVDISYQKDLGTANRLEANLSFFGNSNLALIGNYQWVWNLSSISEGIKWYAGPGVGLRLADGIGVGLCGQIGIEYTLQDFPLQFSLDARPGWYLGDSKTFGPLCGLGVRYKF